MHNKELGIYIHIPFCRKKCDYCGFYSIPVIGRNDKDELFAGYINALFAEIKARSGELNDYTADTIYFGGGSPSLIDPANIGLILSEIHKYYKISGRPEITIECNPDDFSAQRINEYKQLGINRIVLGIQTLDQSLHKTIGRYPGLCGKKMLDDFFSIKGISHCLDIITGIPGQSASGLEAELDNILSYRPEHVSAYTLSIESGTPLSKKYKHEDLEDMQRVMLEKTMKVFASRGYSHYEVSNYCLPSYESKHNMKYWKFLPYIGFGAAAHSFYNNERYINKSSVEEYIKRNGNVASTDIRNRNSGIVEFIMSGMRLAEGISSADFEDRIGIRMPGELLDAIKKLESEGFLEIIRDSGDTRIRFTTGGFFLMDSLIYRMTEGFL